MLIRTVLRNERRDTVTVQITDDPMAYGSVAIRVPRDRIFLRSGGRRRLAPGDSVVGAFKAIVDSPPGLYELTVRHATEGADVRGAITVRGPP